MTRFHLLLLMLSWLQFSGLAQTDFNNYVTLLSSGEIPSDFTKETYNKILEDDVDREELKGGQERVFLEGTNYAIDEILHSGIVVYGDAVTQYIQQVANKLLRNEGMLQTKLRFYTIKSNVANAFSTDQGIVFVTTGLIAQLTSEAQLAYILSHEISHYAEKHVLETFDLATSRTLKNYDRINKLSQHSKENEFEADKLGIARYHAAGYASEDILSTFDVLMYSYLPFDEIEFPKNYFNTNQWYVPETLFPSKKYEIKAEEDYDDENSTHPNVKKRKEAASAEIGALSNWDNNQFFCGENQFKEIRNICRFENVRCDILDAKYGDALYSLFLLERDFPNSLYLKRMKAQIWLNLMLFKSENIAAKAVDKTSELEGESASLHSFLKKLNKEGMTTLALRQLHDIVNTTPNDPELQAIYNRFVANLAENEKFKTENYSKKSFQQAAADFEASKSDTLKSQDPVPSNNSKYDRIKNKKNADLAQNFDSSKFYLYGITDILSDPLFTELYSSKKSAFEKKQKEKDAYNSLSRSEKKKYDREERTKQYSLGMNEVIVVEPIVLSYKNGSIDYMKSEKLEENFSTAIQDAANLSGITAHIIDSRTLTSKGTQGYNERSTLTTLLNQLADEENIEIFPVDYQLLKTIQTNFGTNKVMFSLVEHEYSPNISFSGIFSSVLFYPALLVYVPVGLLTGSNTEINVLVLDLEKGSIVSGINYYFKDSPKKQQLGAHMYDILKKFSSTANN